MKKQTHLHLQSPIQAEGEQIAHNHTVISNNKSLNNHIGEKQ